MPFVLVKIVDRQPPVLRAGRDHDRARGDLVILLQADNVASVARLERERAEWGRQARLELPRLGDGAAGQLRAADPGREPQIVLDPPRRSGLSPEAGALDDERVEALRSSVDGGPEAGGAGADHEQVCLLPRPQLATDSERARDLAG